MQLRTPVSEEFIKLVDDIVCTADNDPRLKDCLKWMDDIARERGTSFYEVALAMVEKYLAEKRAKEWMGRRFSERP